MIFATCATIAAVLASASPGETIRLADTCTESIRVLRYYSPRVTIEADGADLSGVDIVGGGVILRGGTVRALNGYEGVAQRGYGVRVFGGRDVTIEGVRFVNANRAVAIARADNIAVRFSRFEMGHDGVNVTGGSGIDISHNEFVGVKNKTAQCTTASGVIEGLSSRACLLLGGKWVDGWHQDAIQYRNGIQGFTSIGNTVRNITQGVANMDSVGDARVNDVLIDGNNIEVTGYHSITDVNSTGSVLIARNKVGSSTLGRKAPIRAGVGAVVCGNLVANAGDFGGSPCL